MRIFLYFIITIILSSCISFTDGIDHMLHPENWVKKKGANEFIDIIYDTVFVKINQGQLEYAGINDQATKILTIRKPGSEFIVRNGESVKLIFDGIDNNNTFIDIVPDEKSGNVVLKVKDRTEDIIYFTDKCQTYTRYSLELPEVKVGKGLSLEQVVYTPLFDINCNHIGWNLRYGSIERGCNSKEILNLLNRFNECSGGYRQPTPCYDCPPIPRKLGLCKCNKKK